MTPRTVVFSLFADMESDEFIRRIEDVPFTRILIYDAAQDDILGFVIKGEVLMAHVKRGSEAIVLRKLVRPIESNHAALPVDRLFQRFINQHHQIMLVVDDYGTMTGIVTLEDILETIFGFEIMDELDKVPDLQAYARELWAGRANRLGIATPAERTHQP